MAPRARGRDSAAGADYPPGTKSMNRRHFLMSTAVMAGGAAVVGWPRARTRPSGSGWSGCGGRGSSHVNAWSAHAERRGRRRSATSTSRTSATSSRRSSRAAEEQADRLHRHPQAARGQGHRRDLDRHAEPLAHAADDLGLPGRQGRLRREAAARTTSSSRSRSSPRRASTTASCSRAARAARHRRCRKASQRMRDGRVRRDLHGARPLLQVARHHRQDPGSSRCRRASITTCGPGRRRSASSPRTASTTTGTGSGTPATATSATRASTKWTSRAGASA